MSQALFGLCLIVLALNTHQESVTRLEGGAYYTLQADSG